ncbi:MAG: hydroxymethylbilane synthase [Chloroflexota bacterium]
MWTSRKELDVHGSVNTVVVGTRPSSLAVAQCGLVVSALERRFPDTRFSIKELQTQGDAVKDLPISAIGDKGIFVRSIERALLNEEIDVAVHSLKDVPSGVETPGLQLAAYCCRANPHDVLVSGDGATFESLAAGARVGTSSLRRRAQLQKLRPDLRYLEIRGNVDTRLRKLDDGRYDALVLAVAGLQRLGLESRISAWFEVDAVVPDAGQGILAVQTRTGEPFAELAQAIDEPGTRVLALAERAVVSALEADCRSPVGAHARIDYGTVTVLGMAASEDLALVLQETAAGPVSDAIGVGKAVGGKLRARLAERS